MSCAEVKTLITKAGGDFTITLRCPPYVWLNDMKTKLTVQLHEPRLGLLICKNRNYDTVSKYKADANIYIKQNVPMNARLISVNHNSTAHQTLEEVKEMIGTERPVVLTFDWSSSKTILVTPQFPKQHLLSNERISLAVSAATAAVAKQQAAKEQKAKKAKQAPSSSSSSSSASSSSVEDDRLSLHVPVSASASSIIAMSASTAAATEAEAAEATVATSSSSSSSASRLLHTKTITIHQTSVGISIVEPSLSPTDDNQHCTLSDIHTERCPHHMSTFPIGTSIISISKESTTNMSCAEVKTLITKAGGDFTITLRCPPYVWLNDMKTKLTVQLHKPRLGIAIEKMNDRDMIVAQEDLSKTCKKCRKRKGICRKPGQIGHLGGLKIVSSSSSSSSSSSRPSSSQPSSSLKHLNYVTVAEYNADANIHIKQ
jgi:hypothetical protein